MTPGTNKHIKRVHAQSDPRACGGTRTKVKDPNCFKNMQPECRDAGPGSRWEPAPRQRSGDA
eukprot:8277961-Alexandrium_andersonii.AAC.1